ncbi:MAG TPA: DUF3761 domain-containing protein [Mycobacterium sp.]
MRAAPSANYAPVRVWARGFFRGRYKGRTVRILLLIVAAVISAGASYAAAITAGPVAVLASCGTGYYQNSSGQCVPDPSSGLPPVGAPGLVGGGIPSGATAICRDGDYSYSTHHSGTCSGHGGVKQWISN